MASKNYRLVRNCARKECKEHVTYTYATQREYQEAVERYADTKWCCQRHGDKNMNPHSQQRVTEKVIICVPSTHPLLAGRNFWDTGAGFEYGDTWNAYAEDFPAGAKIIVRTTVEVVLPNSVKG